MLGKKFLLTLLIASTITGCSTFRRSSDSPTPEEDPQKENAELKAALSTMTAKVEQLENKLSSLNEKVDQTRTSLDTLGKTAHLRESAVESHPADVAGDQPRSLAPAIHDPEAGYVNDSAIQAYRKGLLLHQSGKFPEAILAFSSFLELYADHPLAGSAQYFIGNSYFKQKEYKLAIQEYERVLTSYDRSHHVPETLKEIAEAEEVLKKTNASARHRQLLLSLFPQSPAAVELREVSSPLEKHPAVKTEEVKTAKEMAPSIDEPPVLTAPIEKNEEKTEEEKH